jgi:hypothetical protein
VISDAGGGGVDLVAVRFQGRADFLVRAADGHGGDAGSPKSWELRWRVGGSSKRHRTASDSSNHGAAPDHLRPTSSCRMRVEVVGHPNITSREGQFRARPPMNHLSPFCALAPSLSVHRSRPLRAAWPDPLPC